MCHELVQLSDVGSLVVGSLVEVVDLVDDGCLFGVQVVHMLPEPLHLGFGMGTNEDAGPRQQKLEELLLKAKDIGVVGHHDIPHWVVHQVEILQSLDGTAHQCGCEVDALHCFVGSVLPDCGPIGVLECLDKGPGVA
jgi:hypothetical protein